MIVIRHPDRKSWFTIECTPSELRMLVNSLSLMMHHRAECRPEADPLCMQMYGQLGDAHLEFLESFKEN